jgi:hypothetical protein
VITVNQVVDILVKKQTNPDWADVLAAVLPGRKIVGPTPTVAGAAGAEALAAGQEPVNAADGRQDNVQGTGAAENGESKESSGLGKPAALALGSEES